MPYNSLEKQREHDRKYRLNNRDKQNQKSKKYRESHLEEYRKKRREYYQKHKKEIDAKNKIRRHTPEYREKERLYRSTKVRNLEYYQKNKERLKLINRKNKLKETYNITPEEFHEIWIKQSGNCAICNCLLDEINPSTHLDHNHKSGKIRGILCRHCNALLGFSKEDILILKNTIYYIEKYGEIL